MGNYRQKDKALRKSIVGILLILAVACSSVRAGGGEVTAPPAELKLKGIFKAHYTKYFDAKGLPILGGCSVPDAAFGEAARILDLMFAHRPKMRKILIESDMRLTLLAPDEVTTDLPECRGLTPRKFSALRSRGLAGHYTSFGSENLLNLPGDRQATENILIHEVGHRVQGAMDRLVPGFDKRVKAAYKQAVAKGLWKDTYAGSVWWEYWAEGAQIWFNANRSFDAIHNEVGTREELKAYDPDRGVCLRRMEPPCGGLKGRRGHSCGLRCGRHADSKVRIRRPAAADRQAAVQRRGRLGPHGLLPHPDSTRYPDMADHALHPKRQDTASTGRRGILPRFGVAGGGDRRPRGLARTPRVEAPVTSTRQPSRRRSCLRQDGPRAVSQVPDSTRQVAWHHGRTFRISRAWPAEYV